MSTYALQTETMLQPISKNPIQLLGTTTKQDAKTQLPSKRKREALCGLGSFTKSFTIRPCPGSASDKPVLFKPVRIIGRSQLPLTFIDTSPGEDFAANALFSAHISILEDNAVATEGPDKKARVLVARHETKRMLYAVERVRPRVYSICRLASWIKEKDVGDLWDPSNLRSYPTVPILGVNDEGDGPWWQHAIVATEPASPPAKRARLSMMRKPAAPVPAKDDSIPRHDTPVHNPTEHTEPTMTAPADEFAPELPSPQEQLESLVHQYLDAVYLSKTSLAYFAKGPLNRIRNAFTSPDEGAPPTYDLVTALRAMLLSPKASEKKYHEKLPSMIKTLPPGTFSDDETAVKVKKSKKKMKLSRDGVYPQEDTAIRKWWHSDTSLAESSSEETLDQRIKRRIGDLRVRETLTQLILMLEIVALEALSTYKPAPESQVGLDETQAEVDSLEKPKKRKKKLEDITVQLDLLLDRLCIWHATEEAGILDFDRKPTQQFDDAFGSTRRGASDRLRDFCVEVIIPFYMNRLPEQALMVNKKLGGPAHNSPPKRKAMKPPAITRKAVEPKEPETKKSRRSLTRVATERGLKTSDRKTPSLSRSATDSNLLSRIKREGSEVALSAIPFQRSPSKNSRRSISQFRHLEGRELDLTTPSAAVTAKMKQKQRVEEDLKEAISALKKPNRGLAAGGYVDDLERRNLGSASRSRKPMNPVRKVVKDVQVTATPRLGRRTRDVVDVTPDRHYMSNPFARHDETRSIPSGELCIPSSGVRQAAQVVPGTAQRSATGRNLAHSSVAETPSKAPNSKSFDSGGVRRPIFATPLKPARVVGKSSDVTASQLFGSPAQPFHSSPPAPLAQAAVPATPTKVVEAAKPSVCSAPKAKPADEDDIYAALGWNDDDDM